MYELILLLKFVLKYPHGLILKVAWLSLIFRWLIATPKVVDAL